MHTHTNTLPLLVMFVPCSYVYKLNRAYGRTHGQTLYTAVCEETGGVLAATMNAMITKHDKWVQGTNVVCCLLSLFFVASYVA